MPCVWRIPRQAGLESPADGVSLPCHILRFPRCQQRRSFTRTNLEEILVTREVEAPFWGREVSQHILLKIALRGWGRHRKKVEHKLRD